MADQARLFPADPSGAARLTQVLARKAGSHYVDGRKCLDRADVGNCRDAGEANVQDLARALIELAQHCRFMAPTPEAKLDPPNSGEESGDRQTFTAQSTHRPQA
jgi:hypothetical protein